MNQVFEVHDLTRISPQTEPAHTHTSPEPLSEVAAETLRKFYKYLTPGDKEACERALEAQNSRFPEIPEGLLS